MSNQRGRVPVQLSLLSAVLLALGSCRSVPVFHGQTDAKLCKNKTASDQAISVDDQGGVSPADECVVIGRNAGHAGHTVRWTSRSGAKDVSIVFILIKGQAEPFQELSCSKEDPKGIRLCVLTSCPDCKATFKPEYQPVLDPDSPLNYYYYSPGVRDHYGAVAQGADPGIRIER